MISQLISGASVFVQKQNMTGGLMLEMEGTATLIANRVHVRGNKAQMSFSKADIADSTLDKSTGKVWVYLK